MSSMCETTSNWPAGLVVDTLCVQEAILCLRKVAWQRSHKHNETYESDRVYLGIMTTMPQPLGQATRLLGVLEIDLSTAGEREAE
jgi:hypothetical protein